jgi:hydroxymethylpyrimidine/phosphomethylpyrimidine kinase
MTIVTIGGVDPTSGAGVGRDLLTARALGSAVQLVGTAWTVQSQAGGVRSVEPRAAAALADAVRCGVRDAAATGAAAVKIGMVAGPEQIDAILRGLEGFDGPVVVDPVMNASSGGALWLGPPDALMALLRRATVATPNADEAAALWGRAIGTTMDAAAAARALRDAGIAAVLLKGGHVPGSGDDVVDLLVDGSGERRFAHPRVPGRVPRGTGCALATALAVHLAAGLALREAAARATDWLAARIAAAVDVGDERHLG